jgi:hypothetical protein
MSPFQKLTDAQAFRKSLLFMELEGPLPYSQQPATGLYPKKDKSTSHNSSDQSLTYSVKIRTDNL